MPPVTRALIFANVAVFGLQALFGAAMFEHFALWPLGRHYYPPLGTGADFEVWQLVTSAFMHDPTSLAHIFFNMFALWMFGRDVEDAVGSRRFAALYFGAVLTGSLTQLIVVSSEASMAGPTVGASGGVFGVLLAFGMLFPRRRVMLIFPPIPMPAWLLVTLYGGIELLNGVFGTMKGIAHFAHLGGMLGAWLVLQASARRPRLS
jgi:membrane associated rhomboid family serine protease